MDDIVSPNFVVSSPSRLLYISNDYFYHSFLCSFHGHIKLVSGIAFDKNWQMGKCAILVYHLCLRLLESTLTPLVLVLAKFHIRKQLQKCNIGVN